MKIFWFALGVLLLGIAYLGVILPGIPWSTPAVGAAYCFAKSSTRMHKWIYSHKLFGPFLIGWQEKRIFPLKFKFFMVGTMSTSLLFLWFTTGNVFAVMGSGGFMLLVGIWSWRYPSSYDEYQKRVKNQKRIGWLK
jgi:hypothetical protein